MFGIGDWKETTQEGRFADIPRNVPYMFGIGGRLNTLWDLDQDNIPEWRTIDWSGDPPAGHVIGRVYFSVGKGSDYVEIGKNHEGGSIWQKIEDEPEKLSWKTGRKEWKYIVYAGPEFGHSVEINNGLNENGWVTTSTLDDEEFNLPEGLENIRLQPSTMKDATINHLLVFDPDRAEMCYVKSMEICRLEYRQGNLC